MRGTAIQARNEITLTNIIKVPFGRAMAATYNGLLIINVYAPSGTARLTDGESFYTSELTCVLKAASHNVILGVISNVYCTSRYNWTLSYQSCPDGDSPRVGPGRHMDTRPPSTHITRPMVPPGSTYMYVSHSTGKQNRNRDHTRGIYRPPCCRAPPTHK